MHPSTCQSHSVLVILDLVSLQIVEWNVSIWSQTVIQHSSSPWLHLQYRSLVYKFVQIQWGRKHQRFFCDFKSIQYKVGMTITGGIWTTAGDTIDTHANILPIDLVFNKVLFRTTMWLCSLPCSHPLHCIIWTAAHHKVKQHRSPICNLLVLLCLNPGEIKIVKAVRCCLDY